MDETVVKVLYDAGIDVNVDMIAAAQRIPVRNLGTSKLKSKPITFKLTRRYDLNSILRQQKAQLRDTTEFRRKHPDVFMTEDLTPLRQSLSYKLRSDQSI